MRIILFIVSLLFSICVQAQQPLEKTLLWKITGSGISKPSYLYGTIHLMCADEIKVSDSLRAKFYSTKKLFLEINIDDASAMAKTMLQLNMKNDTTLTQLLPKQQYDSLATEFQQLTGLPLSMMNTMKPALVESMVYPSMLGCKSSEAWEQKFSQMAKANNMKTDGLETVDDQLKIFDEIPYKTQAEELAETILQIDSTKKSFTTMLNLYKQKDLQALSVMINKESDFPGYEDMLLLDRNKKWIPEIIEQAKLQPSFFAVGAGHLGGNYGVINLLKQQGYIITPVYY